jgi:thiamine pyrophosphate-dependent acetolactate synthase large subunit-like protein
MNLQNPDMVSLAGAFNVEARRVDTLEQLEHVFRFDVKWDRPFLIEFRYPLFPPPW